MVHLAAGNNKAAEECFQRAVNVTSTMAKQWIEVRASRVLQHLTCPNADSYNI